MITTVRPGKGRTTEIVKRPVATSCQGRKRAEQIGETQDFQGSEFLLYVTVMVDTHHYTSVKNPHNIQHKK